jgi:hypothetical protein
LDTQGSSEPVRASQQWHAPVLSDEYSILICAIEYDSMLQFSLAQAFTPGLFAADSPRRSPGLSPAIEDGWFFATNPGVKESM